MYTIERIGYGHGEPRIISEEEYDDVVSAIMVLKKVLSIEEKYEIVLANFLSYERCVASAGLQSKVTLDLTYGRGHENMLAFNRRIINFLTSARTYQDHLYHDIGVALKKPSAMKIIDEIKLFISQVYDGSYGYRFMYELRNFVQHEGLAVDMYRTQARRGDKSIEDHVEIMISVDRLRNGSFKNKILNELAPEVSSIDLTEMSREYASQLSNVNEEVRTKLEEVTLRSRAIIEETISNYIKNQGVNLSSLHACKWNSGELVEKFTLMTDWDEVRKKLSRTNKKFVYDGSNKLLKTSTNMV